MQAISTFIKDQADVIIPVTKINKRWVSLDGHTRLVYAVMKGYKDIQVYETATDKWVEYFVKEALARNILSPYDLKVLAHDEYEAKWNQFCEDYFSLLN
ncbi:hypothetical protein [Facklamia sp. P9177]|uniref:hypothetical protein n=1 Tax=Facklamia sp. P9177 TaxID=3421945 RepID=UPI003D1765BB